MITTEYTVVTPCGSFTAQWDEDPDEPVKYVGSTNGIAYFRDFLATERVTGAGGISLDMDGLEPADIYGFCQSKEYGIVVLPDPDSMLAILQEECFEQEQARLEIEEAVEALKAATDPIEKIRKGQIVQNLLVLHGDRSE